MTPEANQPIDSHKQPELKQVLGALLFTARKPMTLSELRVVLEQASQNNTEQALPFGKIQESAIRAILEQLQAELVEHKLGLFLVEVAGGFRFHTDPDGGPWVRQLLNLDKPARLSKPALETLAIIAYRQPATRAEIEALRGVNVDAMMRHLLELQLIRIVGRSELPGRPLMYGTTQIFLEHFGLSSVKNLPGVEQLSRRDAERVKRETDSQRTAENASAEATRVGTAKTTDQNQATTTKSEPDEKETDTKNQNIRDNEQQIAEATTANETKAPAEETDTENADEYEEEEDDDDDDDDDDDGDKDDNEGRE